MNDIYISHIFFFSFFSFSLFKKYQIHISKNCYIFKHIAIYVSTQLINLNQSLTNNNKIQGNKIMFQF